MTGIKDALETAVGKFDEAADNIEQKTENTDSAILDRIGNEVLPTAESETDNATPIAPDATVTPVTHGRRTVRPDGQDPFRGDAPAPVNKS